MVRINFKTIDRRTFHVDVDLGMTVEALIETLAEHGIGKGAKLAYAGKVLKGSDTLASYGLGEGKMVIVATQGKPVSKPTTSKPTPATPAPAAVPAGAPHTPADAQPSTAASTDAPKKKDKSASQEEAADPNTSTTDVTMSDSSAMSASGTTMITPIDPAFNETVSMLCEMTGADADKVQRALAASYNNPDRAAELLFSGAPLPTRQQIEQAQNPAQQPSQPNAGGSGATGAREVSASQTAAMQLMMQPQFRMLQEAVQENPASLESLLEQLGNENPDLLRLLNDNQDLFLEFLNQPAGGGPGTIRVTPEEKAAIERLQALGFPADLAIQAYFACEKNEEAAANFLFNNRDFGE
jgi:UV excision repair protein RAD23